MEENVMDINALPDFLFGQLPTAMVKVSKIEDGFHIYPEKKGTDCTIGLRGIFAGDPNMTVEKFFERKRIDKELDL